MQPPPGTPEQVDPVGDVRDRRAEDRDQRAEVQDQESETRDERGEARDQRAEARDEAAVSDRGGQSVGQRAEARDEAASDRAEALSDRRGAANDRLQAADDREAAASDRVISARERAISSIDDLTGAHRRDAGTLELERELARAKRTGQSLVLAFIDVDGLKERNDLLGHAAGDQLLRDTVHCLRTQLRSYDLIVRFGGDEFVCALFDMSTSEATLRFAAINADLKETSSGSITVGLTELRSDDTLEGLIARADDALYSERERSTHHL